MTWIPNTKQCREIWDEFDLHEPVRKHSKVVNEVAMFLAKKLKNSGADIDLDLVNAASLLHDLDKISTLKKVKQHGTLAKKWLKEKELFRVGNAVERHGPVIIEKPDAGWEDKVVHYADKRVQYIKIVSLKKRFNYIKERYKDTFEQAHEDIAYKIEKEIFSKLKIKPEQLMELIK
ncbi:HDIG domain-containing protein [Candidatus Woesearchaeota archaeon]|nr:HDIG domain-containing protein [Candidatus Woesearchaeota archaeon]